MRTPYTQFKGTTSQYKYLHVKVGKSFGKPLLCEDCGTTTAKRYDWANLGSNYGYPYVIKREDWKRLCRSCHQKLDARLFIGKRYKGFRNSEETKQKKRKAMKKFWAENPNHWDGKMRNQWTGAAQ